MSVRRKLFLTMAALIAVMSLLYILVTVFVVQGVLRHVQIVDRSEQIESLSELLISRYDSGGQSWIGLDDELMALTGQLEANNASIVLRVNNKTVFHAGEQQPGVVHRLGIKHKLVLQGDTIGVLHYYDPEAAGVIIIQHGVSSSVTFILLAFSLLLLLLSLLAAYLLSRKLTAPLRELVPAITRLGQGDYGAQATVFTQDEYGTVAGAFNAMSTQLKLAEENRKKLVADVAHELRTPLAIIQGQLELLQQSGKPVAPEELLPLQDDLIRLTRLTDDLHQLSLAEARRLPLQLTEASPSALLSKLIDRFMLDAEDKHVALRFEDNAEGCLIGMDEHRMAQVFLNLIGNAIRYTPEGGSVTVRTELLAEPHEINAALHGGREHKSVRDHSTYGSLPGREPASPSGVPMLKVTVADTGPGIAAEHLPHIFDRFYRTDEARSRSLGGMGLGLAIAKEFVHTHGGSIHAESRPGAGTAFIVLLPFAQQPQT